jgi:hypothetical protein
MGIQYNWKDKNCYDDDDDDAGDDDDDTAD